MSKASYINIVFFVLAMIMLFSPFITLAQVDTPFFGPIVPCGTSKNPEPCNFNHLIIGIKNLINFAITLSIPLAAIAFTYAGFLYVTAAGDSGQVGRATAIFKNVGIGFIIILAAWLIVFTITNALLDPEFIKELQQSIDIER